MPRHKKLYSLELKHSIILGQLKHSLGIGAFLSSFFRYPKPWGHFGESVCGCVDNSLSPSVFRLVTVFAGLSEGIFSPIDEDFVAGFVM